MKLFGFEKRWLSLLCETLIPSGADPRVPLGAKEARLDIYMDDVFSNGHWSRLLFLRAALWFTVLVLAPVYSLKPRTFAGLSEKERIAFLRRLKDHPLYHLREIPTLWKMIACMGYCGLPSVQAAMGIETRDPEDPPWARGRLGPEAGSKVSR